jgi:hypothetical protein
MSMAILSSLLLAGAELPATDAAAIDARVREIFHPYSRPTTEPVREYRGYSAETATLIAHWERVQPKGEVDDLNDGDWFCLCQDWDNKKFRVTPGPIRFVEPGVAEVNVSVDVGFDEPRGERLVFKRETNGWRLDDLFAADGFPRGLKQALRDTIRTDEAPRNEAIKR